MNWALSETRSCSLDEEAREVGDNEGEATSNGKRDP